MTDSTAYLPDGGKWNGNEYSLPCPGTLSDGSKCGKRFSWNTITLRGQCFKCKLAARGEKSLQRLFGPQTQAVPDRPQHQFRPVTIGRANSGPFIQAENSTEASQYLLSRGVGLPLMKEIGVLYSQDRVWFPISSPMGLAPSLMGRDITGLATIPWKAFTIERSKYVFGRTPPGSTSRVILVEGIMDLVSPGLWGKGFSLLGSHPSLDLLVKLGNNYKEIILWLDPDQAGREGTTYVTSVLRGWFPSLKLGFVNSNKTVGGRLADPGEHTPEEAAVLLAEVVCG